MRAQLLPNDRALLLRATTEMNGHHGGATIDCGEHAVAVDTPLDRDSMVWFSLGGIDGVVETLGSFTPSDREATYERFGRKDWQYRYEYGTAGSSCFVCNKDECGPRPKVVVVKHGARRSPWCHYECRHVFCDILDRVWELSPRLLADCI